MKYRLSAVLVALLLVTTAVFAIPAHARGGQNNNVPGGIDAECRAFGFDHGIGKWEVVGNHFVPEEDPMGTSVSGKPAAFSYDAGDSGADGIVVKAGRTIYEIVGTSGDVEQDRPETSHVTFCGYDQPLSCQEVLDQGLLSAQIENGVAVVHNNAGQPIEMNLAVYEMYAAHVTDQLLYDSASHTAPPGKSRVSVDVPRSAYQADLVCGPVLEWNPQYGDRVIAYEFGNFGDWATPTPTDTVELVIADFYPQGNHYVFECNADFDADSYNWYLGDGDIWIADDGATDSVYHVYDPGEFTVACTALSDDEYGADTLEIQVE